MYFLIFSFITLYDASEFNFLNIWLLSIVDCENIVHHFRIKKQILVIGGAASSDSKLNWDGDDTSNEPLLVSMS